METEELLEFRLTCLTEEGAEDIVKRCAEVPKKRLGGTHSARQEGRVVVIAYTNKLWPYDVIDMADDLGLIEGAEAERAFSCL